MKKSARKIYAFFLRILCTQTHTHLCITYIYMCSSMYRRNNTPSYVMYFVGQTYSIIYYICTIYRAAYTLYIRNVYKEKKRERTVTRGLRVKSDSSYIYLGTPVTRKVSGVTLLNFNPKHIHRRTHARITPYICI